MTTRNDRSNHEGILFSHVMECPVCGERVHSFCIRKVTDLLTVDGEFYHRTATCAGSMTLDMTAAMDLLRLAVEAVARGLELPVHIEWSSDFRAIEERSRTIDPRAFNERTLNSTQPDLPSSRSSDETSLDSIPTLTNQMADR